MNTLLESVRVCLATKRAPKAPAPTLRVLVSRSTRLLGPERRRFVGGWQRGTFETYQNEQLAFSFAPESVTEDLEIAVIDTRDSCDLENGRDQWRMELASEQHLWDSHRDWTHDPVPTEIAYHDEDGLVSNAPYTLLGVA